MILCSSASPSEVGTQQVDGITVVRVDMNRILNERDPGALLTARRTVSEVARTFRPDVVHAHDVGPMAWLTRNARRQHPIPLITTVHTMLSIFTQGSSESPFLAELKAADRITAVSQSVADDITGLVPLLAAKLSVIPNGVMLSLPITPASDAPHLAYVGRLVEGKRVDLVIEAVARLAGKYPALRLTIAGIGPCESSLRQLAASLGITDRVDFVGLVAREHVPDILRRASAVVLPSEVEGLPIVALETACMGRPIVGTRSPGLADAVIDGETGLLVEQGDLDGLTAALDDVLAHPERARALGAAARARAEREFSLELCADRYEALYERVVAQSP